jgi:MYXO-CTERM domain-containing protein
MVVLERESMLRHPLMVALAGVSTLSLTTAATADLTNGTIEFEFNAYELGTFVWVCEQEYDAITGVISDVTITDVVGQFYFQPPYDDHATTLAEQIQWRTTSETLSCTIQFDVEGVGPWQIDMQLEGGYLGYTWYGSLNATYGPYTPFGAGESFTGDWSARVVPAPGALALLGVAGLAGRRRRD